MSGPIDSYLDELVGLLSTRRPQQLRSLLAEAETHLRDDADAGVRAGLTRLDAEAAAVARFGRAELVALAERETWRPPFAVLAKQFLGTAALLGGIAATAIGLSGIAALLIRAVSSARFLVASPTAAQLTPSNCARWLGIPNAGPGPACRSAAINDWVSEVVAYRLAAGVVGVAVILLLIVRARRQSDGMHLLPALVTDTIAAGAFCVAGVWLLASGVDALVVSHGNGAGQWLSAAPVALAAAAAYGLRLIHDLQSTAAVHDPA